MRIVGLSTWINRYFILLEFRLNPELHVVADLPACCRESTSIPDSDRNEMKTAGTVHGVDRFLASANIVFSVQPASRIYEPAPVPAGGLPFFHGPARDM